MLRQFGSVALLLSGLPLFAQTPICTIQGSGASSPFDGQTVTTTGVVTAVYSGTGTLQGFFIEDPACDGNAITSNGLFVYKPNVTGIALGDRVSVTGTVQEYLTLTELYAVSALTVIGSGAVTPTNIQLPMTSLGEWERYEGMLLRFPQQLQVVDNDDWAQYGELSLAFERLWQPTDIVDPNDAIPSGTTSSGAGNTAAVSALATANTLGLILLDDGRTGTYPDPPPLLGPQGTLRCGSTVTALTGVLHYMYGAYRLQPVGTVPLVHAPRPAPPEVGGTLRIASFNVHNYWSTLGGFGAANSGELTRQRTKLVAALVAMDADALVLCELQDNDVAWMDLLAALNAQSGPRVYEGVERDEGFGTKSVIFFDPAVLTTVTDLYWIYNSTFERAHITQGFQVNETGGRFLLSSAHPHSKLCDNATGADLDQGDGQGCYNAHRRDQAQALVAHWAGLRASTGIQAQLVMGDFNSYYEEDPLDLLRANGLEAIVPASATNYSFRYGGWVGALDHAFGTSDLIAAITGAAPWAINADEPPDLDYPDANIAFYQANAFRSSDHDPLIVGIDAPALSVGIGRMERDVDIVRFTNADRSAACWTSSIPFHLEVVDMLGRPVWARGALRNTMSVSTEGIAAGHYYWRCFRSDESLLSSGAWAVQ